MKIKRPSATLSLNAKPSTLSLKAQSLIKDIIEAGPSTLVNILGVPISDSINGSNVISEEARNGGFYLWTYGRSDLFHWSDVLDKFDDILNSIIISYGICNSTEAYDKGDLNVQQKPFMEQDLVLTKSILSFSKILLENSTTLGCYSSSDRLICLLMTDDAEIVELSLQLLLSSYRRRRNVLSDSPLFGLLEVYTNYLVPLTDFSQIDLNKPGHLISDTPESYKYTTAQERLYRVHSVRISQNPEQFELVRLHALSLLLYAYDTRSNNLFRTFPTLISDTARLIGTKGTMIESAAMRFASQTLRFDIKWDELRYALQLDSINGTLMNILKRILEDPESYQPQYLITFFELFSGIISNAFFDASIISANFVDVLLRAVTDPLFDGEKFLIDRKVYRTREKLLNSLDILIRRWTAFSDSFFTSDGLHRVTQMICALINFLINNTNAICRHAFSSYLTQLLRLIDRLLTTRTDDRMRNMIDGPIFRNLKLLFESYSGDKDSSIPPLLFTKATSVLANYIHNEPTCLSILQEQRVTTSLLDALARENSITPEPEMLKVILHAFGALCLNPTGYEDFKRINPLKQLLKIFKDANFRYVMSLNDFPMQLGATLDEFCRHHPQLREFVFKHVVEALETCFVEADADTVENLGCRIYNQPLDLPRSSLNGILWYLPNRIILFQAFCMFLEALLRSAGHTTEFHENHNGIAIFLKVLKNKNVFHYHFYVEQLLSASVSLLKNFHETAPEIVANGLINQLKRALLKIQLLPLDFSTPENKFLPTVPFHDFDLVRKRFNTFNSLFQNRCHVLGLLGIIHDLYFSSSFPSSSAFDIASKFWDKENGDVLPGMCLQAHMLSMEYYHILTDTRCKQLVEQSIELFDGRNIEHIHALNTHMVLFLLRHTPSQIIAVWSTLIKRICTPPTKDADSNKIDMDAHNRVCRHIIWRGTILPLNTISQLPNPTITRQCLVMNTITTLNTTLFDEISYKIQANPETYDLFVSFDNGLEVLEDAFTVTCEEDTPCRTPLFEAILFWFTRIATPNVYKTTFWADLVKNGTPEGIDRLFNTISKWTLIIARIISKQNDTLGPNILILFFRLISNLTLQNRSPMQGQSVPTPPGEAEFLQVLKRLHSPSNNLSESFRTLFHDLHDLMIPLTLKFMKEILAMPEQIQKHMTQELVNHFLCRYECFGWNGIKFLSNLIPEIFPPHNTLTDVPLSIRMKSLVLLLHTTNKTKLLYEIVPAIPSLTEMLTHGTDTSDCAVLILTEYIALKSLPPISNKSSTDINDPSFDGGIKKNDAQNYEWQLPSPNVIDHKRAFEDALSILSQHDLTPNEINAYLRLVVACLKIEGIQYDIPTLLPILLRHAPRSVIHNGTLLDTKVHNSVPNLISIALRLIVESQINLMDYIQLDLVSKYSTSKAATKDGVELNSFVLDSKASILRNWKSWLEAAKSSLIAKIPSKAIARTEQEKQANQQGMTTGLVHVYLQDNIKQNDIITRILEYSEHSPVMDVLIELAFNDIHFYPASQYIDNPSKVADSQLDFMCIIGNIAELATSYPNCHRTLMNHSKTERLFTKLILNASFNNVYFNPCREEHVDYLESFESARNCWLHLLLHTALFGSIFDRNSETRKKLSPIQVGWCRLVVDALASAWSQLASETDDHLRLAKVYGVSTIISILLDINNPQIGLNDLPDNLNTFGRRQSAITMMLAAQMIERNVVSILSENLEYVSRLSRTFHKLHVAIDTTTERICEALELLSKLSGRLGKVGKTDLGTLTSKLATMSSLDFSLHSEDSDISETMSDRSDTESMSIEDIDDSMTESGMSMMEDYGYETELQSEESSMDDEDEEEDDLSIVEMSVDEHDSDDRHVTFDIISSDDEDASDSESSFQQSRIPPGILEDAVMQVLQRSGINPADAPIDIILEQEEDEYDNEGGGIRGFYNEYDDQNDYDSYGDEEWDDHTFDEEEDDESRDVDHSRLYDNIGHVLRPPFEMHRRIQSSMSISSGIPRNVYASEIVIDRTSYNPWADPSHSALEAGFRPNPPQTARRTDFNFFRDGFRPYTASLPTPEIYPHPYQYSFLPPQYLDLFSDPMKSIRQTGMSLFKRAIIEPSDSARYRIADITPKPIKWPEIKPFKHYEIGRSLEQAMIVPTHRRWIQLVQTLYSFVSYPQTGRSMFIFDNPSLPYIDFSSGLAISVVPLLREAMNAKELEASVGFINWNSFSLNSLPSGINEASTSPESHSDHDEDDESMSEESETREDRHQALTNIVNEVTGQVSSTLIYEDPGIDVSFIEAMPFDLLDEAFQQHFSERRRNIRTLRETNNTQDWPQIRISESFLTALPAEVRSTYEQMSNEDDLASRLFGQSDNEYGMDEEFDDEFDDGDMIRGIARRTPRQETNTNPEKKEEFEGLPLADPSVLISILKVHYHPNIGRPKSLFRALLYFCSNRCTRENLLGLLLFILQRCPVDDEALDGILSKFVKRQSASPNASGSASKTPSTPKGNKESSPLPPSLTTSPTFSTNFSQRQVVILQRTLQLLMQLIQKNTEVQAFFVQEDHADSWSIKRHSGKREPILTTKFPLVVLLAVIENPVFMRIVNEAGPSGSMVLELLLHLIAIVAERIEKSETCPEVPPFFLQVFARCLASPTELTPRAQTHAIHILQRLTKHPSLAAPLISEIASLANGTLLDSTVQSLNVESQEIITHSEHLLRLMKLFSSMLFAKSPEQVDSIQTHLASIESLPSLQQILQNPSWNALCSALSLRMSSLEAEESRSLHLVATLLPSLESYLIRVRLLLAILKQLKLEDERSAQESELVQFAERHRRSLNFLIQTNPSLLTSGSFHLFMAHPKILDFDNKRILFKQQLHRRPSNTTYPGISLNIRRQYVFEDSFHQLISRTGDEVKFGKLTVKFHGEEGVDVGGVTREWFSVLTRAMFNPDYALFKTSASDRITYQPNRLSSVNPDHLQFFRFVGRVIGKAIYDNRLLDAYFTRSFYKHMLGQSPDFRDLEAIDPEFHKSLLWTLEHDITGVLDWTFSVEAEEFGQNRVIDLIENGHSIPVTETNKRDYVKAMTEYKLTTAIKPQIDSFLTGFREIVPEDLLKIFSDSELELLISGMPDLDVEDWRAHTEYHGSYSPSTPVIQWFWRAVRNFEPEDRAKLLQFVTGTSKVPMEGFAGLQGSGGVEKFQIHRISSEGHRLPTAHTCFNQLDLPEYSSYEDLRDALLLAISECSTGFGFV